jgi:hypothetical protein
MISIGIVDKIKRFKVLVLAASTSPKEEKRQELKKRPMAKDTVFTGKSTPKAIARPTIVETTATETNFDKTYSTGFTGETAILSRTLWFFSKRTIAPMKYNPKAAGSENISKTASCSRQEWGIRASTLMYRTVITA